MAEPVARLRRELVDQFDRVDGVREFGQNRRLVAKPGTDLEHLVGRRQIQQLGHQPDDERLRNGLFEADRQRHVGVGIALQFERHELVPRYLADGLHHPHAEARSASLHAGALRVGGDLLKHAEAQRGEILLVHADMLILLRRHGNGCATLPPQAIVRG